MKNENLIYKYNCNNISPGQKLNNINIINGRIVVTIYSEELNDLTVRKIIGCINYINERYKNIKLPILFNFKHIKLMDKLSFVLFECIIKTLLTQFKREVEVVLNMERHILTEGIFSSPLLILTNQNKNLHERNEKFIEKFKDDYFKYHFRRVLRYEDYVKSDKLSKIYDDLAYFQNYFHINYDCREEIAEVVVELLGNAIEHSKSDCLVDFDIALHYKNKANGESVCGINIAILNFSEILLGTGLDDAIKKCESCNNFSGNYVKVKKALDNHAIYFDESYDKTDFFNISTFQNKVSSRDDNCSTGGTGLTKLIKSIEDKADNHSCYVLSGDRIIIFDRNYLEYNGDWIGFNEENDYFNKRPYFELLRRSEFYMPGTAYNLTFIMKVNDDEK